MNTLRIAIVSDIHHGQDSQSKKGSKSLPLLEDFVKFVADAKPDLVVDLGDRISDFNHDVDLVLEQEVADVFTKIKTPVYHLNGNHDRDHLTVAENEAILGQSLNHQTLDIGEWRLVFWRADSRLRKPGGFILNEADLFWLAGVIKKADRPLLIMSHVPLSGHSQASNYYFSHREDLSTYDDIERVRAVLRTAHVPVLCIAGHVHWNTLTQVDGIPHLTLQSLTETFTTFPDPAGAWAMLELSDVINWQVFGKDSIQLQLPVAQTARRWLTPWKPAFREGALPLTNTSSTTDLG